MGENQYPVDLSIKRSWSENEILQVENREKRSRISALKMVKLILFLFLFISLIVMFWEPGSFEYAIKKTLIYFQTGEVIQ